MRYTPRAERELRRLDRQVAARVLAAIERLAAMEQGDVKQLHGGERVWRLRVGDWRILLDFDRAHDELVVLHVLHRGQAYCGY